MTLDELMHTSNRIVIDTLFDAVDSLEQIVMDQAENDEDRDSVSLDLDVMVNFAIRLRSMGWSRDDCWCY